MQGLGECACAGGCLWRPARCCVAAAFGGLLAALSWRCILAAGGAAGPRPAGPYKLKKKKLFCELLALNEKFYVGTCVSFISSLGA